MSFPHQSGTAPFCLHNIFNFSVPPSAASSIWIKFFESLSRHSHICRNLAFFPHVTWKLRIQSRPPLGYWKEGCRSHLATYFSNVIVLLFQHDLDGKWGWTGPRLVQDCAVIHLSHGSHMAWWQPVAGRPWRLEQRWACEAWQNLPRCSHLRHVILCNHENIWKLSSGHFVLPQALKALFNKCSNHCFCGIPILGSRSLLLLLVLECLHWRRCSQDDLAMEPLQLAENAEFFRKWPNDWESPILTPPR